MIQGGSIKRRMVCLAMAAIFLVGIIAGCDIFNSKDPQDGWKSVSMPSDLKGDWYLSGLYQFTVSSNKVVINNRTWGINRIERKEEDTRLILENSRQYFVMYFRSITSQSVYVATGLIAFTLYDAEESDRTDWMELEKGEVD